MKNPDIVCFHSYKISKVENYKDGRLILVAYTVAVMLQLTYSDFLLEWRKFQSWLWEERMPANILKSIKCILTGWLIWPVNYFSVDNCYCWVIGGFLKYIFCTIPLNYLKTFSLILMVVGSFFFFSTFFIIVLAHCHHKEIMTA